MKVIVCELSTVMLLIVCKYIELYIHTFFLCLCHGLWLVSQFGSCPHWSHSTSVYYMNSISFCLHVMFNVDCVLGTIRSLVSAECCSSLTSTTTSACPLSISRSTTLTKAWSTRSRRHISTSSEFLPYYNHIYSIYSLFKSQDHWQCPLTQLSKL